MTYDQHHDSYPLIDFFTKIYPEINGKQNLRDSKWPKTPSHWKFIHRRFPWSDLKTLYLKLLIMSQDNEIIRSCNITTLYDVNLKLDFYNRDINLYLTNRWSRGLRPKRHDGIVATPPTPVGFPSNSHLPQVSRQSRLSG